MRRLLPLLLLVGCRHSPNRIPTGYLVQCVPERMFDNRLIAVQNPCPKHQYQVTIPTY